MLLSPHCCFILSTQPHGVPGVSLSLLLSCPYTHSPGHSTHLKALKSNQMLRTAHVSPWPPTALLTDHLTLLLSEKYLKPNHSQLHLPWQTDISERLSYFTYDNPILSVSHPYFPLYLSHSKFFINDPQCSR